MYSAKHHCNVVVGDFNCPQINWNAPLCFANEYACNALLNWIITYGFTQFVVFPTRETSILDLVLCDSDQLICDVSSSPPIGHSDHCVVDFSFLVRDCKDDVEEDTHPTTGVKYKWHMGDLLLRVGLPF